MAQCSICLSSFKDPVCIPCGHVYCKRCLSNYANAQGNNGLTANCPECRTSFELVVPDLTYLPEKYHKFVTNNVRRVYVDFSSSDKELREALRAAEDRLTRKAVTEQALLSRCEALTEALHVHRQGEKDANERIMDLEADIVDLEKLVKEKDNTAKVIVGLEKLVKENDGKLKELQKLKGFVMECVEKNSEMLEKNNQVLEDVELSRSYHDIGMKQQESGSNTVTRAGSSSNQTPYLSSSKSLHPKRKQRKYVVHLPQGPSSTPSNAECTIEVSTMEDAPIEISMSTGANSTASLASTSTSKRVDSSRVIRPLPKRRGPKKRSFGNSPFMSFDISDFL